MRAGPLSLAVLLGTIVGSCIFPTEHDSSVHVSLTPLHIVALGADTIATATAWQMTSAHDSVLIPNVVFVWTSSDPGIATVDARGRVVGANSGTVVITAAAANFDTQAHAAADTVRVAAPLDIDSIRPKSVRYGEMLSIYGVGVDSIVSATLSGTNLIHVSFSDTTFAGGTERSKWWVPPPAHTDSLFFLGISGANGVFGFFHDDTIQVVERDLFEPDDTVPHVIDLDAAPPFAVAPTLLFYNPALAFEVLPRGVTSGADWYRLSQGQPRDVTIILTAPQVAGTFVTYVTDSLGWNGATQKFVIGHDSWTYGPRSHACHGLAFAPGEAVGDSTIVAFKGLKAGTLDAIALYGVPGRYGLGVVAGYQSELPADFHEDDNSCNAADLRLPIQAVPFRDSLTIENPHDIDWIRFTVSSGGQLRFRLHALAGVHPDSLKDLDLYVIKVPNPGDTALQIVLADTASGSDVNRTIGGLAGSYYAVVLDYAGTTTQYEICVAVGSCPTAFPAPSGAPHATRTAASSRTARFVPAPSLRLAPGRSP